MNRLMSYEQGELIGRAFGVIPAAISDRLRDVEFLTGTDPVFAGLHRYETTLDGRAYRKTAHTSHRHHSLDGTTTIVLPVLESTFVVVHELGHALDELLGYRHVAKPVTAYGRTNRQEAFAESFCAWLYWYGDQDVFHADLPTVSLFESLR